MRLKWSKDFKKLIDKILDGNVNAIVYNTKKFGAVLAAMDGSYALIYEDETAPQEIGHNSPTVCKREKIEQIISHCLDNGVLISETKPIKVGMHNLLEMRIDDSDDKTVYIQEKLAKNFPAKSSFYYCGAAQPILVCSFGRNPVSGKHDTMSILGLIMPYKYCR